MRTMACSYILIGGGPIDGHIVGPILLKHWAILLGRGLHFVRVPDQGLIERMAKYCIERAWSSQSSEDACLPNHI